MLDFIKELLVKAGFSKPAIERIENIEVEKTEAKPVTKKKSKKSAEKPVAVAAPAPAKKKTKKKVTYSMNTAAAPVKVPNLNAMSKQKIVDYAKENGIELNMTMTKKSMIAEVKSKLS